MKIAERTISKNHAPFIIAEMSGNHNHSIENALEIVRSAAKCGVSAIKIQTYTPDTITLKCDAKDFKINNKNSLWNGRTLYDIYSDAFTPWEWHESIFREAEKANILCFSSPFDLTAVDFLEELNVPAYKIASPEIKHIPLLKRVSQTGKPILISTGIGTISDIYNALDTVLTNGCTDVALLKCTTSYPADPLNSNIKTIEHMRDCFNCEVGLSDHTLGIGVAVASIACGATVIEKHFTLDRASGGIDSSFSLNPAEMTSLVRESESAWKGLGGIHYDPILSEDDKRRIGRSIYISKDVEKDDLITEENIKIIRPGYGMEPDQLDLVIGRKFSKSCSIGTPLNWTLIQ